jgi:AraC family transcriptional activator of pobA
MREIAGEYTAQRPGRDTLLRVLAEALIIQLLRHPLSGLPALRRERNALRILRLQQALETHFTREHRVAFYADVLGVTPTYLNRICRAETGRAASALIQERVLREARRLLQHTHYPVKQVAASVGFEDPAYFSRYFQRLEGMSPTAFRRARQSG